MLENQKPFGKYLISSVVCAKSNEFLINDYFYGQKQEFWSDFGRKWKVRDVSVQK